MKARFNNSLRAAGLAAMAVAAVFAIQTIVPSRATEMGASHGQLTPADYQFAEAASRGGALEVNLGKMASEKSADPAVQQFGLRMVQDHGKAGKDLQEIASRKGATLPTEPDAEQQKQVDHLDKLSGIEFDRAYMSYMVKDHKADLKEFKHAAEKADDAELKSFAVSMVPMIDDHLRLAEGLESAPKAKMSFEK